MTTMTQHAPVLTSSNKATTQHNSLGYYHPSGLGGGIDICNYVSHSSNYNVFTEIISYIADISTCICCRWCLKIPASIESEVSIIKMQTYLVLCQLKQNFARTFLREAIS